MPSDWSATADTSWLSIGSVESKTYHCGYCSVNVASARGWLTFHATACILICPQCNSPTFFSAKGQQVPGRLHGGHVMGIGDDIEALYKEARQSFAANAFTGAVMLCRKILMNVSVKKDAKEGLRFAEYVKWLVDKGYVPTGSEGWVTYIKNRGNEANHEIDPMTEEDARSIISFTEHLLRNMFELPNLIPSSALEATTTTEAGELSEKGSSDLVGEL